MQRHSLFNHLIPPSEAFSPTAATESTRKISSCITKLQECPINFHHVFCFGDHSKTTNIILSTGNQCHLPPLLAPSLVQLSLISWLNILHQETSGKLITKTFEGRHEELPVLTKKACGDTFTMHSYREETSLQPGREVGTRWKHNFITTSWEAHWSPANRAAHFSCGGGKHRLSGYSSGVLLRARLQWTREERALPTVTCALRVTTLCGNLPPTILHLRDCPRVN